LDAILILEDGFTLRGRSFGSTGIAFGEVVFNTCMTGYQEILTDPSYCGQLVAMTYPHIGNYGVNGEDIESSRPALAGFIVRDYSEQYSNWRARNSLHNFLVESGIVGIREVDTRALTRHIRDKGALRGAIATGDADPSEVAESVRTSPAMQGRDLVREVTTSEPYDWPAEGTARGRVAVYDYGVKWGILRSLARRGLECRVLPSLADPDEIRSGDFDGLVLSNGPGDPDAVPGAVERVRALLGEVPILGICMGHQILALAAGGRTFKLKFGHHGGNQPVRNLRTGRIEITSQNHGFAVDPGSLPTGRVEVSHVNLNDDTVEGMSSEALDFASVQYHPEASPGPHDSAYVFDEFVSRIEGRRGG
jgi:carbamoyl-phosphate synthase small subunit